MIAPKDLMYGPRLHLQLNDEFVVKDRAGERNWILEDWLETQIVEFGYVEGKFSEEATK